EHAGLLHDIGKISIPDEILLKPGAFTHAEYEKMKEHPVLGYQIVKPIKFLAEEALIILHHHEWYNGEGYPNRLKGKEIPQGARIVSVLDAYDTMRAAGGRYKRTLNCEESVRELIEHAGTQFDPEVVLHFVQVLLKRGDLKPGAYDHKRLEESVKSLAA
ncbi:MAG: HD domain-containing protein, partial [Candidatus Omnitrophica bacterium]|nr:HD domain-containing protein [Candidatus Omnitrophota bacterium]